MVNHRLHAAARRAEALGWRYEAHRRGLELCSVYLPTTHPDQFRTVAPASAHRHAAEPLAHQVVVAPSRGGR